MKYYVYKVTNKINNKIYIGATKHEPVKRLTIHMYNAKYNKKSGHNNYYFHRALLKYGIGNFTIETLFCFKDRVTAFNKEIEVIKEYNANNSLIGYNLTKGGDGVVGHKKTKEQIEKQRLKMIGRKLTDEHKKNISKGNIGKKQSKKTKEKISKANSGICNGMYNRPELLEHRIIRGKLISAAKNKLPKRNIEIKQETILKLKEAVKNKLSQNLTDEQKDEIINLYNSGNFIKRQLAIMFNTTENTIKHVIRYWDQVKGNKHKHISKEKKAEIIAIYNSGIKSRNEISLLVDLPADKVNNIIKVYKRKLKLLS